MGSCMCVNEGTVATLESFGSYSHLATPGCSCLWFGTNVGQVLDLRLRQTALTVDTRTRDNVFITLHLVLQWAVVKDPTKLSFELDDGPKKSPKRELGAAGKDLSHMSKNDFLYEAAYSTQNPEEQLKSLAEEYFRIVVVKHKMDKLFDLGSSITTECTKVLNRSMNEYGYHVKKVVIKDIEPEKSVMDSMNDIVASEKERVAAVTRADAEKITRIKAAEAQAEVARLQGEGIAKQRFAICEGLRHSVEDFASSTGSDATSVMSLLMLTQHTDMIKESLVHSKNVKVILQAAMDSGDVQEQVRNAMLVAK